MSAEPVRRRKNRKTNTSLGIPHTFSFPLLPTHECRAVNLHMMTLKILFHMDVKLGYRKRGFGGFHLDGNANPGLSDALTRNYGDSDEADQHAVVMPINVPG